MPYHINHQSTVQTSSNRNYCIPIPPSLVTLDPRATVQSQGAHSGLGKHMAEFLA